MYFKSRPSMPSLKRCVITPTYRSSSGSDCSRCLPGERSPTHRDGMAETFIPKGMRVSSLDQTKPKSLACGQHRHAIKGNVNTTTGDSARERATFYQPPGFEETTPQVDTGAKGGNIYCAPSSNAIVSAGITGSIQSRRTIGNFSSSTQINEPNNNCQKHWRALTSLEHARKVFTKLTRSSLVHSDASLDNFRNSGHVLVSQNRRSTDSLEPIDDRASPEQIIPILRIVENYAMHESDFRYTNDKSQSPKYGQYSREGRNGVAQEDCDIFPEHENLDTYLKLAEMNPYAHEPYTSTFNRDTGATLFP